MKTAIEKLQFVIGMKDLTSGPLGKFSSNMQHAKKIAMSGAKQMAGGIAGVAGSAYSLIKATNAGREMNKALGDVKSVGASNKALKMLEASADRFASKYGGNSADIVRSGYDIQSAITGLKDEALGTFTASSALLAKAGKSTSDITTKYTGVMFNIFEKQANKIGQSKWVDQLTGKSAKAIEMFSTNAGELSAAFTNVGSSATIMGYDIDQQMATLGILQGTMGGANAGTALKAMMGKFAQAQKELNLSFKDAKGNMLPMHSVIEKIKNSVGELDKDKQVAKLNKAFGEEGAKAVMNLFSKTETLKKSVHELSNIKDSSIAEKMALNRTDVLDAFTGKLGVLWKNISKGANTALKPVLQYGSKILEKITLFMQKHPTLTTGIGAIAVGIIALTTAFSAFIAVMEFVKMVQSAILVFKSLSIATHLATVATHLFNAALWLNPITWIVGLIIGLIAVIALCVVYWKKITGVFQWGWNCLKSFGSWFVGKFGKLITMVIWSLPITWIVCAVIEGVKLIWSTLTWLWKLISPWVSSLWEAIKPIFIWIKDLFLTVITGIWNRITGFFTGVKNLFFSIFGFIKGIFTTVVGWIFSKINWIFEKLTKLPIIGEKIQATYDKLKDATADNVTIKGMNSDGSSSGVTGVKSDITPGGATQNLSNTNNTTYVDSININSSNAPSAGQIEEYTLMTS
ncbi:phage tail tape measure protein [Lentisphaerota bacterium WC36G]|nr:phage tail tape measure protein [Lentisphaerae bacterium WC36]